MAAAIGLITLFFLLFLFFATRNFLDLWDRLQQLPSGLFYAYLAIIIAILLASGYFIYRLLRSPQRHSAQGGRDQPLDEEQLRSALDEYEASGMDIAPLRDELAKLHSRKQTGQLNIAFFGDVSTGKSSIIKALLPEADIEPNLRGGSTREIREYQWETPSGDRLLLTDLPGRNEADGDLDIMARDEAVRAQMVVYVVDSDFSRTQYEDVKLLLGFGKPLLLAFNKQDQYTQEEREQLRTRIAERFPPEAGRPTPKVLFIQSGGMEEVIRVYPDGREETLLRPRKADVSALTRQIQQEIDGHIEWLEQLRDASVFNLVKQKLDESRDEFRRSKAEKIVRTGTRNAILGSLAAISPGTDIVIQGVIGTKMVKDLCDLYESPIRQLDIDNFLDFSQGQVKKSIPLLLAVAGNGLKAFPGVGTVAGGLVHAVAYGLIFDALGHSVAYTLEKRGALKPAPAALTFREMLSGNLEGRTKAFARLVVDQYRQKDR
ncbi:MAG: GTPase [Thiolinea sp.]